MADTDIRCGMALWSPATTWDDDIAAARLVDELDYDSRWTNDHLLSEVGPTDQPTVEDWTTLAAWASVTERATLGHWVGANTFRNPALAAKLATTVDHASRGRCVVGIGSGWFAAEQAAFGVEFGRGPGERLDWLDESVGIPRRLFAGETVTHDGPRYRVEGLTLYPPPVRGKPPIMIGGSGEQKTLRTVANYADMWDLGETRRRTWRGASWTHWRRTAPRSGATPARSPAASARPSTSTPPRSPTTAPPPTRTATRGPARPRRSPSACAR